MKSEKLFPMVLIVLDVCIAIGSIPPGDLRQAISWMAAAILTVCVTY